MQCVGFWYGIWDSFGYVNLLVIISGGLCVIVVSNYNLEVIPHIEFKGYEVCMMTAKQ